MKDAWELAAYEIEPSNVVCLGLQCLVVQFRGALQRLPQPRHGMKTYITSQSTWIFEGLSKVHAVQYHSLNAILGHQGCAEERYSPRGSRRYLVMTSSLLLGTSA